MEPKDTTVEATEESVVESASLPVTTPEETNPVVSSSDSTSSVAAPTTEVATPHLTNDIWKQVTQLWEQYFGEGKKSNLTLAISIVAAIPLLIAISTFLELLNKLPLLPSVFELVGFGYSVWFVYRYLLLANTRKELIDGISSWKHKVFG